MKKYLFMMAAATVALASCSSSEDPIVGPNETPTEEDYVAIEASASRATADVTTRAVVDAWAGETAGLFVMEDPTFAAASVDWTDVSTYTQLPPPTTTTGLMANDANGVIVKNGQITITGTTVTVTNNYYYPRSSTKNYTFYGYYPYVDDTKVTMNVDNVVIKGEFNGTQDVMFAKADAATPTSAGLNGWNAAYIRAQIAASATSKPDLAFEHLTSQLSVTIIKGIDYDPALCGVIKAYVLVPSANTLTFKADGTKTLVFDAIDPADGATFNQAIAYGEEYKGAWTPGTSYEVGDIVSYQDASGVWGFYTVTNVGSQTTWSAFENSNINTTPVTGVDASSADQPLTSILIPTKAGNSTTPATVELMLVMVDGSVSPVTITAPSTSNDSFEAGKNYQVKVKINGPQKIEATASVAAWAAVDGGTIEF